ncbi:MAG: ABC transporter ATP-binding protein [Chloroflexota bacterium]
MINTYNNMIGVAGSQYRTVQKGIALAIATAIVQGIIFSLLFPFFRYLFAGDSRWQFTGWVMVTLIVIDGVMRWIGSTADYDSQMDVGYEARVRLGEKLRTMPLEYLTGRQAGDLNVVLSGNVDDVVMIMGGLYGIVLNTIIAPLTTIVITLFIDWRLALALAVIFPMAIPLYQRIRAVSARENRVSGEAHAVVTANLVEYAQGLEVLRSTRQVGEKSIRLQESLADLRYKQSVANNWGVVPNISMSSIVQIGILLVTTLGAYLVIGGTLEVAVLFALLAIAVRYAEPLSIFASLAGMFDFMEAGLERINGLLAVEPLPVTQPPKELEQFDITFDNVDFAYAPENEDEVGPPPFGTGCEAANPPQIGEGTVLSSAGKQPLPPSGGGWEGVKVLHDISFRLPAKTLTALVGESGGGKTTITKLITRYADPQKGSVKIGGLDIRNVEPTELMKHISVVFQDVYLFDDTIRNNIRMAKPSASDAEVEAAAQAANCHEFITRLPDGYDTTVGEIGGALSGGERQRISIARAILKDAPIVLLDEPTSALDTESEVAVQRAIDRLVEDKTVVVIAHRLSTVVAADTILVLEDGRITERGTHAELLALDGRYAAMWAAQQQARRWKVAV